MHFPIKVYSAKTLSPKYKTHQSFQGDYVDPMNGSLVTNEQHRGKASSNSVVAFPHNAEVKPSATLWSHYQNQLSNVP